MNTNLLTIQQRSEHILKSLDPSHGGVLVSKEIIDRRGHHERKWVKRETGDESKGQKPPEWWDGFKKYKLNTYPIGVPKSAVKTNEAGDINSHWVLQWKDPKTGAMKSAYTTEFLQRNAEKKWERISNISSEQLGKIKQQSNKLIKNGKTETQRGAAAIIYIISETGLRRGDKAKFAVTGNRGVSTLAPENITIKGNRVSFNFTGKSYQENTASVNNAVLATYLAKLKEERNGEKFLFTTNDSAIDTVFDSVGGAGLKLKDLRTYVATDTAKKILFELPGELPPLPAELSVTKKKKLIKDKLNKCYELVSQKLNNTPAMARTAYIHPHVVTKWLETIGVDFDIKKAHTDLGTPSLDSIIKQFPVKKNIGKLEPESEEMCDVYENLLENYN